PPEKWTKENTAAGLRAMRTGLDMVCPVLCQAGGVLTIPEEEVFAGRSRWRVFAHAGESCAERTRRTQADAERLIAALEHALADDQLVRLMDFVPGGSGTLVRKTSVSAVIRDEKRAAQEEEGMPRGGQTELMRLPRFMEEKKLTGAGIGTALHRMMRMLDLDAIRRTHDLRAEIARQAEDMLARGVVTEAEYTAVPVKMMTELFASPLGRRLLRSPRVEREWAFTYLREEGGGAAQLVQGVIDCCFEEDGRWVLVDYKTDSPSDVSGAIEKHRPQLEIYAAALETITGMPVAERILYLVRAGAGYAV
ncbi:MAG: PD-(D/E)XK nuclease family protein, partial [Clostridia bacterium]|nr:PD-(D/E)XK nuclease family protein [Clostridia bacterium]